MPRTVCFTSFSLGYLARARVLAGTVKQYHPDWEFWALIVDTPPASLDRAEAFAPFDQFCYAAALGIPKFRAWMFKHDVVEACTAVKGQMLVRLLEQGADRVIYLDPDIALFQPLTNIEQDLETTSIVLTPHQVEANTLPATITDNEMTSMKYGVYNLGFLAVRNDPNGRAFAHWWAGMTYRACYESVETGQFTDQKYCDLVPSLFDGVHIERDPGCNVASWNLSRRKLSFSADGTLLANGATLKFYHFTKIGGVGDVMTERYAGDNVEVHEVVNWYKRQVRANTIGPVANWPWQYGRFANGAPVLRPARLLFRGRPDLADTYSDPFSEEFHAWLVSERVPVPPATATTAASPSPASPPPDSPP